MTASLLASIGGDPINEALKEALMYREAIR